MTNKIFNKKLYLDSLKQLRTVGIIFTISSICISLIYPILMFFDKINSSRNYDAIPAPHIGIAAPSLYIIMFLGSIIFVMTAFSFLNKRSASDFYHSLPNTRNCTFLSITTAVLTWLYTIIIGTVIIVWLTFSVLGLSFNALHVPYLILMFVAGTTLVVACALIAVSITGTAISTLAVTLIMLFVPRIIMSVFTVVLLMTTQIVPPNSLNLLINQSVNIPYGFSVGLFLSTNFSSADPVIQMFSSASTYIYTIILSISYFVLAMVLFNRRNSEYAERSAPNKLLQHLYRLGVTLPVLLIISILIGSTEFKYLKTYVSYFIVIILISFIINCVYELITIKQFKSVLKSIPIFVVAVGFVFGLGFISKSVTTTIATRSVNIDKLEYVRIVKTDSRYSSFANDYTHSKIADIKIADKSLLNMLSTAHNNALIPTNNGFYNTNYISVGVEFNESNTAPYTRTVLINNADNASLIETLTKYPDTEKAIRSIPEDKDILSISITDLISPEQVDELWNSYKSEISELPISNVISSLITPTLNKAYILQSFNVNISSGIHNYHVYYSISSKTPKTADLYVKMANDNATTTGINAFSVLSEFNAILDKDPLSKKSHSAYISAYISLVNCTNNFGIVEANQPYHTSTNSTFDTSDAKNNLIHNGTLLFDDFLKIAQLLPHISSDFDSTKPYVEVSYYIDAKSEFLKNSYSELKLSNLGDSDVNMSRARYLCYINITDKDVAKINQYIELLKNTEAK